MTGVVSCTAEDKQVALQQSISPDQTSQLLTIGILCCLLWMVIKAAEKTLDRLISPARGTQRNSRTVSTQTMYTWTGFRGVAHPKTIVTPHEGVN